MMKLTSKLASLAIAAMLTGPGAPEYAMAAIGQTDIGQQPGSTYYFDWQIAGNAGIAPVQIFDDGRREWLQFADPTRIPAIFADTARGQIVVSWTYEPPYVVIDHPESELTFRVGRRIARATRGMRNGPPEAAQVGMAQPVRVTGLAPDPVNQQPFMEHRDRSTPVDSDEGMVTPTMAVHRTRPAVTVQPDPHTVAASGSVQSAQPTTGSTAARFVDPTSFSLCAADGSIADTFKRWGDETGWTITWDTPITAPITGASTINGSLSHALTGVILGLRQAGYPVWISAADPVNRTFRVFQTQDNNSFSEIER